MNKLSEFSDGFDRYVSPKISFINNQYVSAVLMILIIAYAGIVAPRLPENIVNVLDHPLVKLIVFFLIVFIARQHAGIAIVTSIAVLVTLMTLNKYNVKREMMENLSMMESNLDKCNSWDCERIEDKIGQDIQNNDVEGNESEFTESGYPIDFSGNVEVMVNNEVTENVEMKIPEITTSEMKTPGMTTSETQNESNILSSSINSIKNFLQKANIIEGYENSDSNSYSDF